MTLEEEIWPTTPEEEIRRRSYLIWQQEGRPFGRELKHWGRAKAELEARCEAQYEAFLSR